MFFGDFASESEKEIQNTFCPYLYWALQSAEEGREGKKEGVLLEEDHKFLFRVTTAAGCHRLGIQLSFFCICPESRRNEKKLQEENRCPSTKYFGSHYSEGSDASFRC